MELPDIGRYRRRFIVEFGPEDSGLIDRMGIAHRTKRAAIIAGLRLLESGDQEGLHERVAALEQELATTSGLLAAAQRTARGATPKLDKAKADLAAERAAHRRTRRQLDRSATAVTEAQRSLRSAKKQATEAQAERDRVAELLPDRAFCPDCEKLVAASEWAEQATATGVDVYHKVHRYHAKGTLRSGTTPMFQRRPPGQAGR